MHSPLSTSHPGYIFLLSVLVIGAIAIATTSSLILLGISAEQSGQAVAYAHQARELAHTCAERALRSLRADSAYTGNESFTLTGGTCTINTIVGSGNANRYLCAQGTSGQSIRKLQINISQVLPTTRITSWKEVSAFTLCP